MRISWRGAHWQQRSITAAQVVSGHALHNGLFIRFHKSKKISAAEAELILEESTSSLNDNVVICHDDEDWYDVRLMTPRELHDFVADLLRADLAAEQSGIITPH